jgi:hypothetical protein
MEVIGHYDPGPGFDAAFHFAVEECIDYALRERGRDEEWPSTVRDGRHDVERAWLGATTAQQRRTCHGGRIRALAPCGQRNDRNRT